MFPSFTWEFSELFTRTLVGSSSNDIECQSQQKELAYCAGFSEGEGGVESGKSFVG